MDPVISDETENKTETESETKTETESETKTELNCNEFKKQIEDLTKDKKEHIQNYDDLENKFNNLDKEIKKRTEDALKIKKDEEERKNQFVVEIILMHMIKIVKKVHIVVLNFQ